MFRDAARRDTWPLRRSGVGRETQCDSETCAIVGGILAMHGGARIPGAWLAAREPLAALAAIG